MVRDAETHRGDRRRVKDRGFRVLAMAADGDDDLYRADLSGPIAFVFGNEAHGLPADVVALADGTVRVPQEGRAESLNLAAAATVCLFEWQRRRLREGEALETIIGAAAHDIRSPLTAMKGFGYALEKRWDVMTEEQRAVMLQGIVHDADRMDTILRQLVDAARVVGGNLEIFPEQVDVAELVLAIAENQRRDPDHPPVEWGRESVDGVRGSGEAQDDDPGLHGVARVVGPRRIDPGPGLAARVGSCTCASRAAVERPHERGRRVAVHPAPARSRGREQDRLFVARGVAESQGGRAWGEVAEERLIFHAQIPVGF